MKTICQLIALGACCLVGGCSVFQLRPAAPEDCIDRLIRQTNLCPEHELIFTLDGKYVQLEEFFGQCEPNAPRCNLYFKFYCWPNELIRVTSPSARGPVQHQVRAYYNPSSVCYPDRTHPGRIYGDVAEFYDPEGEFMGLAAYIGNGDYYPLPFHGYSKKQDIFKHWTLQSSHRATDMPNGVGKTSTVRVSTSR